MSRKRFEWSDILFDTHKPADCPNRWCRVHYFFNFEFDCHEPFPNAWRYLSSRHGWLEVTVWCGPLAWLPKKPTPDHLIDMARECPHTQIDLTCNYCQRHTFHPYEVK